MKRNGLRLIERNFACRVGELDLIMADKDCTAVIEVRARAPGSQVAALATVDEIKQGRIIRATQVWLAANGQYAELPLRFDVVAIECGHGDRAELQWVQDAFRA